MRVRPKMTRQTSVVALREAPEASQERRTRSEPLYPSRVTDINRTGYK